MAERVRANTAEAEAMAEVAAWLLNPLKLLAELPVGSPTLPPKRGSIKKKIFTDFAKFVFPSAIRSDGPGCSSKFPPKRGKIKRKIYDDITKLVFPPPILIDA
ncbi:hypothetical protein NE237_017702 [Protea cynaroides]|uniref:Uncharacterized protein n=1 Tax=Protea cynaroides TaxID=273540 RepID=A0A9Q0K8I9_9MAGN|nr:hypothetical protein NE237_017702 [Protea cynaroides]